MYVTSRFEPRSEADTVGEPVLRFPRIVEAGNMLPLAARVSGDDIPTFSGLKRFESEARPSCELLQPHLPVYGTLPFDHFDCHGYNSVTSNEPRCLRTFGVACLIQTDQQMSIADQQNRHLVSIA
jgi:hypothetical protein